MSHFAGIAAGAPFRIVKRIWILRPSLFGASLEGPTLSPERAA